jgi:hypothetical protein
MVGVRACALANSAQARLFARRSCHNATFAPNNIATRRSCLFDDIVTRRRVVWSSATNFGQRRALLQFCRSRLPPPPKSIKLDRAMGVRNFMKISASSGEARPV